MRCMSCLEIIPRRQIKLCHGCKAWYCPECQDEHTPCNVKSEATTDDISSEEMPDVDDSKPGVWIIKVPQTEQEQFDFWRYVA